MQQFHLQDDESLNTGKEAQAIAQLQEEEVLKHERVTEEEAQKIVHLWAENQRESQSGGPTVKDIAEGLEIPTHEARRLLKQVREHESRQTQNLGQQRQHKSSLLIATLIFFALAIAMASMLYLLRSQPSIAPATAVEIQQPLTAPNAAPPTPAPAPSGISDAPPPR